MRWNKIPLLRRQILAIIIGRAARLRGHREIEAEAMHNYVMDWQEVLEPISTHDLEPLSTECYREKLYEAGDIYQKWLANKAVASTGAIDNIQGIYKCEECEDRGLIYKEDRSVAPCQCRSKK